jgi:hypothetical protein
MGIPVVEGHSEIVRDSDDVYAANLVMKTKNNKGHWDVIDKLVKIWVERTPGEFKGFKVHLEGTRETLADPKFGQTKGGKDMERRLIIMLPQPLQLMIRSVYKADELPFDRKFFREFARRYPFFKVPEKL